jgi:putative copper resistance protein D
VHVHRAILVGRELLHAVRSPVTALGIAFRFVHLAASLGLLGAAFAPLLAGRSDRSTAATWESRVVRLARACALVALVSGFGTLALQTIRLEGRMAALADPAALARVFLDTQAGFVWILRAGLLVVLLAFLVVRLTIASPLDWLAARGEALLLGGIALGLAATAGHAAAVEPNTWQAIGADALHLIAAGVWLGGLLPFALLLAAAGREAGADARPFAVLALRRFSTLALASVIVLAGSGIVTSTIHVGTIPALLGTTYGRLLLAKLALLIPLIGLGAFNRIRVLPRLSGDAVTIGRPAMSRLATTMAAETVVAMLVLVIVAAMTSTPPARHGDPVWPFGFRLSWDAVGDVPAARARVLLASQLAVLGSVAVISAAVVAWARRPLLVGGLALLAVGGGLGLPPLRVDAYPTTYRRPAVPWTAGSIASGATLYHAHCASCHGASGAGDGPEVLTLPQPPGDLRSRRLAFHTAGDLFWWITYGIPSTRMPAFAQRLDDDQRWDVVNFVRALAAAETATQLGAVVRPDGPRVVAPDFGFAVGPMPAQTLREFRDRSIVVLVFYTLPASRARLTELAAMHRTLNVLGAEIVAVPTDAAPDAIARIGGGTPVLFPVVTAGAADVVAAYRLFAPAAHAELLVDRQGFLRARWIPTGETTRPANELLAEIQQLNEERPSGPAPDEHVH